MRAVGAPVAMATGAAVQAAEAPRQVGSAVPGAKETTETMAKDLTQEAAQDVDMTAHGDAPCANEELWNAVKRNRRGKLCIVPEQTTDDAKTEVNKTPRARRTTAPGGRAMATLPQGGYKIVVRPREGLDLSRWKTHQIISCLANEMKTPEHNLCKSIRIQVNYEKNIITIYTLEETTAKKAIKIQQLTMNGYAHPTNVYLAAPENTIKGVVHDVKRGSTPEELLQELEVEDGTRIVAARMLGNSEAALITVESTKLPRFVIYKAERVRCYLYRPQRHVCTICMKKGHRADVCPSPGARVCQTCLTRDPAEGHLCAPKCAMCAGEHQTFDKRCDQRFAERPRGSYKHEPRRSRSTTRRPYETMTSRQRTKSRSRSRKRNMDDPEGIVEVETRSRSRSAQRPANRGAPDQGEQQTQVSWAAKVRGSPLPQTTHVQTTNTHTHTGTRKNNTDTGNEIHTQVAGAYQKLTREVAEMRSWMTNLETMMKKICDNMKPPQVEERKDAEMIEDKEREINDLKTITAQQQATMVGLQATIEALRSEITYLRQEIHEPRKSRRMEVRAKPYPTIATNSTNPNLTADHTTQHLIPLNGISQDTPTTPPLNPPNNHGTDTQ